MVELEVAGVDDRAQGCAQGDAHRVGDRVADPERGRLEGAQLDRVARFERQDRVLGEVVLLDLVAKQAAREGRGVDGHARELGQHVGQPADVVLMRVRDEERLDVGAPLLEVGHVGHHEVDAEHLLVGEHQAAVDHDDLVAVLEHVHVLADLAHPAEGDDAQHRALLSAAAGGRAAGHQKSRIWSGSSAGPSLTASPATATRAASSSPSSAVAAVASAAAGPADAPRSARAVRLRSRSSGRAAMSLKSVSRSCAWRKAAAGWYRA